MPLAGTFDVLDFAEVLETLARHSSTGRLHVRTPAIHATIRISGGRAVGADVGNGNGPDSKRQWRTALDDICFEALRSPQGKLEFQPADEVEVSAGPRVKLETLVAAGRRKVAQWQEVEAVIQSFEAVPRLGDELKEDPLSLTKDRWKVLIAIDGRRNVSALARRLETDLLGLCQLLKPLVECGAVVLDQPEGRIKALPKVRLPERIVAEAVTPQPDGPAAEIGADAGGGDRSEPHGQPAFSLRRRLRVSSAGLSAGVAPDG